MNHKRFCFVETVYTDIIKKHANIDIEGDVLDQNGNVVGKHKGYAHYTIGKEKDLQLKVLKSLILF